MSGQSGEAYQWAVEELQQVWGQSGVEKSRVLAPGQLRGFDEAGLPEVVEHGQRWGRVEHQSYTARSITLGRLGVTEVVGTAGTKRIRARGGFRPMAASEFTHMQAQYQIGTMSEGPVEGGAFGIRFVAASWGGHSPSFSTEPYASSMGCLVGLQGPESVRSAIGQFLRGEGLGSPAPSVGLSDHLRAFMQSPASEHLAFLGQCVREALSPDKPTQT
jgi:hypothetical protein